MTPDQALSKVCAVILSWNRKEEVLSFIGLLKRQTYYQFEIVVVDNASTDGSPSAIQAMFPQIQVICSSRNLGFAGGMNIGIKHAIEHGFTHAWLLNTDMELADDTLETLVKSTSEIPRLGLASPLLVHRNNPDKWAWCGGEYDLNRGCMIPWSRHSWQEHQISEGIVFTHRQVGAALLVSLDMIRKIGLLNERLFAYYEDDDISLRAREADYVSVICMRTVVGHEMISFLHKSPLACYLYSRNAFLLWLPRLRGVNRIFFLRLQTAATLKLCGEVKEDKEKSQAVMEGFLDGLMGVIGERPSRTKPLPLLFRLLMKKPYAFAHLLLGDVGAILKAVSSRFFSHGP